MEETCDLTQPLNRPTAKVHAVTLLRASTCVAAALKGQLCVFIASLLEYVANDALEKNHDDGLVHHLKATSENYSLGFLITLRGCR